MEHNKQDIVQKIQQLAEERQIFAYAKACGVVAEQMTELAEQLAAIQYPIFVIDALYEQHRGITPQLQDQVDALRQEIELQTQALLPELRLRESYVQVLRNFWQMELGLRSGESLLHRTLDEIYQLKICDVQLQRACIRAFANKESAPPLLEAIRQYDMLGEVLDDLMDREEDRYTHNPNRFLAACDAW
ncbi:MAG: hypothetical protein H6765_01215 [Candidatus Peribacteria bacterium]|nr:MAG: hypothetical protein H6765_01215 [Candidatus Peribacteria bacterium]